MMRSIGASFARTLTIDVEDVFVCGGWLKRYIWRMNRYLFKKHLVIIRGKPGGSPWVPARIRGFFSEV